MENQTNHFQWMYRQVRKVVIFVIGSTVLLVGIAMIVLPGPAFIVIPIGLAILATEFVWARKWLKYARRQVEPYFSPQSVDKGSNTDGRGRRT